MFSNLVRWYTFQILLGAMRTGQENLMESYWDLVYVYRYGLPDLRIELPTPWSVRPQPDPTIEFWVDGHEAFLLDILDLALGDPHPQPDLFRKLLGNNQIRLAAARTVLARYEKAIPQLQAEIQRLEKMR